MNVFPSVNHALLSLPALRARELCLVTSLLCLATSFCDVAIVFHEALFSLKVLHFRYAKTLI